MVRDPGGPAPDAEQTSVPTFERLGPTGRAAVYGQVCGGDPEDISGDGDRDGATSDQQDHMTDYSEHGEEPASESDKVMLLGYQDTARAILEYIEVLFAGHGKGSELCCMFGVFRDGGGQDPYGVPLVGMARTRSHAHRLVGREWRTERR